MVRNFRISQRSHGAHTQLPLSVSQGIKEIIWVIFNFMSVDNICGMLSISTDDKFDSFPKKCIEY